MRDDARIAQLGDDAVRHVARAFARPARQQHDVGDLERLAHLATDRVLVVGHDAEPPRLAAKLANRVRQDLRVRVEDARRPHRFTGCDDLVAGRENRHDRFAPHVDVGDANRREHSRIAAGENLPPPEDCLAGGDVRSGEGDAAAGGDRAADLQRGVSNIDVLDHDHGIGATRHHPAGRNGDCLSASDHTRRNDAGVDHLVAEAQAAWNLLGSAERVVRDDGETVDVRSVERRDVQRGDDVDGENSIEGGVEGDMLDAARGQIDGRPEAALGLVAIEDFEELLLLTHRARRRLRHRPGSLRCRP